MIQYPAMSSLVSVNGPSMTVRLLPENLMRKPLELGWSPARSSSTPAFISSSLYLPIAEKSSSPGMTPASDSLLAFIIIMNFIFVTPLFCVEEWHDRGCQRRRRKDVVVRQARQNREPGFGHS